MMTTDWDFAHTAEARVRRAEKAYRLADAVEELGHLPSVEERRMVKRGAGVRAASPETWVMALEIYLERHPERADR